MRILEKQIKAESFNQLLAERRKTKMNYIGMDIHKQFTVAVVKDEQGNKLAEDKFINSEDNFGSFMQKYKPEETKIVIESTCVWEYIYEILEAKKYEVKLANPSRTRAIAEARIKTDIVDAETLADLLLKATFLQKKLEDCVK